MRRKGSVSLGKLPANSPIRKELFKQGQVISVRFFFEDQQRCFRLVQYILDLVGAVTGIDRHHNRANAGEREIDDCPFGVPRHPDRDFVALGYSQTKQTTREEIGSLFEVVVGDSSVREDIPNLIAVSLDRCVEHTADCFTGPVVMPHDFASRLRVSTLQSLAIFPLPILASACGFV